MAKQEVVYILSACVALAIQQAQRVHPIILPSVACLAVPYFSTLSHKRHDKMCVLIFSTTVVWNISHSKKNSVRYYHKWPIPVAARSKAWVCGRSLVGIVGSNPAGGMDVCLLWVGVVCCQVEVSASRLSLVQRSPTECGVSECDREASIMRRPWPTRGYCAMKKNYHKCT